jgi:hypothetical protein
MNYTTYINLFEPILNGKSTDPRYSDPKYLHYTKLNQSRMSRWQKTLQLNEELAEEIKGITSPQKWIVITEHWCGDAAPVVPFLERLAALNPLVELDMQLRDQEPFLINSYLTNGSKSIPKLIVQELNGKDMFTWGPRSAAATQIISDLKSAGADSDTIKTELQNWYNRDKGVELQKELLGLFRASAR